MNQVNGANTPKTSFRTKAEKDNERVMIIKKELAELFQYQANSRVNNQDLQMQVSGCCRSLTQPSTNWNIDCLSNQSK